MKPLNISGCVGKNVSIKCSDWTSWNHVGYNGKYFRKSPCSEDKNVIIKAAFGKTNHKKRVQLTNSADGLFVTFTNLQSQTPRNIIVIQLSQRTYLNLILFDNFIHTCFFFN